MPNVFQRLAAYNAWANARLYEAAIALPEDLYRADVGVFFKSLHGTLNQLLLIDRIWLTRFTGIGEQPKRLDEILFEDRLELARARLAEDARLTAVVDGYDEAALARPYTYRTTAGLPHEQPISDILLHLFNHQQHHRGQGARLSLHRDEGRAAWARPAPDAAGPARAPFGRPFGGMTQFFMSFCDQTIEHFRVRGWMRVSGAFDSAAAASMRDVVWDGLANVGVRRDAPSTWTIERPTKLQKLRDHTAFKAVGSARLLTAIDAILETQDYEKPKRWGAIFVAFPTKDEWGVPASGWHIDANYASQLSPPKGVQIHALFGYIAHRSGATQILSGSHRLTHKWFKDHPPPAGVRSADMRRSLQTHPYIRDLHIDGDREDRIDRFMNHVEDVDGIPLQVVENTGAAGDVILLHPLTLHVAAPNNGAVPRFLLSGAVTTDMHGWAL